MKIWDYHQRVAGVDPRLIAVMYRASVLFCADYAGMFFVRPTEGLRSPERQRQLVNEGKSWTMDSKHLVGKAIDFAIIRTSDGQPDWSGKLYRELYTHALRASEEMGVLIEWGGNWQQYDAVHFQLESY